MIQPESQKEKEERELMFSIRPAFNAPCKLGNWNEDQFLQEEKTAFATYKKERGQLLLQKTKKMFRNLSRPLQLSHSLVMLKYGENYQIVAPDIPCETCKAKIRPVYLAGLVTEKEIDTRQEFSHGSVVVGCVDGTPCVRNTFKFVGCDRDKTGEPLTYNEDFYLQIVGGSDEALYVRCENSLAQMGYHPTPTLSKFADAYCRFKMLHFDPGLRLEREGAITRANDRVIIQNVPTGKNLAVENGLTTTFFGNEYVISCHTFRDTHKMETAENVWKVVGEDLKDINAIVRAAKGEDVPPELLN